MTSLVLAIKDFQKSDFEFFYTLYVHLKCQPNLLGTAIGSAIKLWWGANKPDKNYCIETRMCIYTTFKETFIYEESVLK